jgi:hypothetical protein
MEGDRQNGRKERIYFQVLEAGGELYGDLPEVRDKHEDGLQVAFAV